MIDQENPLDGMSDEDIALIIEKILSMDKIKELAKIRLYNST
jgi:hypothetical protein